MAKFTVGIPLGLEWRGLSISGAAGATHRIPDALYDEFIDEFVTGHSGLSMPGLAWISTDEGSTTQAELDTHVGAGDPHTGYALDADLANHETATAAFSRGGTLIQADGLTTGVNIIAWRAPFACTVTAVKGYRVGGAGATVNARRNGTSNHLASAVSLASADTWTDGGAVQNTAYAAGDRLEIMIVTVTGSPTQVAVQVDLTRP